MADEAPKALTTDHPTKPKEIGKKSFIFGLALTTIGGIYTLARNYFDDKAAERPQPAAGQLLQVPTQEFSNGQTHQGREVYLRSDPTHLSEMTQDLKSLHVPRELAEAFPKRYNDLRTRSYDEPSELTMSFNGVQIKAGICAQNNANLEGNNLEITMNGSTTQWGQRMTNDVVFVQDKKTDCGPVKPANRHVENLKP